MALHVVQDCVPCTMLCQTEVTQDLDLTAQSKIGIIMFMCSLCFSIRWSNSTLAVRVSFIGTIFL